MSRLIRLISVPPLDRDVSIAVSTLSDRGGDSFVSAFHHVDLAAFPQGAWLTGDGELVEEACGDVARQAMWP